MQVLSEGRSRLNWIIEIIEACQVIGERLDLDVVSSVWDALEAEHAEASRRIPVGIRPLNEEEQTTALVLAVIAGSLRNVCAYLEGRSNLHKFRNELDRLQSQLERSVWTHLFARMPQQLAVGVLTESTAWRYLVVSPDEAVNLPELLRRVQAGGEITPELREFAGQFANGRLIGWAQQGTVEAPAR